MLTPRSGPRHHDRDGTTRLGEEQRRLTGGVPSADHDDRARAQARLDLGRGVVHALAFELVESRGIEPAVPRAGGRDHGSTDDFGSVGQPDDEVAAVFTKTSRGTGAVNAAPNFSACTNARWVRSAPEIPVGKPR